jgi:hypothetical protein
MTTRLLSDRYANSLVASVIENLNINSLACILVGSVLFGEISGLAS